MAGGTTPLAHTVVRLVVCESSMARAATLRVPTVRPSTCLVASRRARHAVPSAVARCDVSSLRANHARRSVSWCITPHRSVRTRAARDETNSRPELTEETKPSSKTTISALDALLGTAAAREEEMETDTPKPVVADEKRKNDEKNTRDAKATVSTPPSSVRAALQRNLDGDEGKRGQTSYDEKSPIEMYDPEFDPLSLGPRWVVPWGGPTVLLTLLAVESGFYFAGALAPAIVYSNTRAPGEIPLDDPDAFAKDLQNVFDDPKSFADIIVVAEVVQTIFALSVVWAVANSKSPLPPGWFQFSVFGDDIDVDAGFPLDESERMKAKGGVDAGTTPASKELASKKRKAMSAQRVKSNDWFGEALRAMGLTWLLVGLVTWLAYAVGLRGDDLGSSSNGVIEKGTCCAFPKSRLPVLPKLVTVVHTSRYTRPAKGRLTSALTVSPYIALYSSC